MLSLYYERRHNVIMAQVTGVLSSEDFAVHDSKALNFLVGKSGVRGLYDFSKVEALAVPTSRTIQRGQRPAIIDGMRVVVASRGTPGFDFATLIASQLRAAGHREPTIVATLEEAYGLLNLDQPRFDRI